MSSFTGPLKVSQVRPAFSRGASASDAAEVSAGGPCQASADEAFLDRLDVVDGVIDSTSCHKLKQCSLPERWNGLMLNQIDTSFDVWLDGGGCHDQAKKIGQGRDRARVVILQALNEVHLGSMLGKKFKDLLAAFHPPLSRM